MAEKGNLLVAPQKNKWEINNSADKSIEKSNHLIGNGSATGSPRRVSLGSSYNGDGSGRSSPNKLNTPNYKQDVASRYLRASIGSCHDLCKYGRRVEEEPKPWRILPKRNGIPVEVLVSKKPPVSVERKKAMSMKHMHATDPQSGGLKLLTDNITLSDERPEIVKREVLSSPAKVELSKGPETGKLTVGAVMNSSDTSTNDLCMEQPTVVLMQSALSDASEVKLGRSTKNGDSKDVKSAVTVTPKNLSSVDASQGRPLSRRNSIIKDNKTPKASKSSLKNVLVTSKSFNSVDALQGRPLSRRNSIIKDNKTPEASKSSLKNVLVTSKSFSYVDALQGRPLSERNSIIKDNKTTEAFKSSLKNVLAHSNNTGNVNADRTRKLIKKTPSNKLKNANLHVIKTATGSNIAEFSVNRDGFASVPDLEITPPKTLYDPLSSPGCNQIEDEKIDVEEKENDDGSALTINETTPKQNEKEIVKGKAARKSHRKGVVVSKDKDSSLRKLKFRRGRTVELQSDSNTPRKLKFRGGKVQLVNQDGKADVTKHLKKKPITNKVVVIPKSRKIVLLRRGMEDKKDAQGLFNNVIEETASKLVISRKSKVKALVGAFETVISLQDTKPAS